LLPHSGDHYVPAIASQRLNLTDNPPSEAHYGVCRLLFGLEGQGKQAVG